MHLIRKPRRVLVGVVGCLCAVSLAGCGSSSGSGPTTGAVPKVSVVGNPSTTCRADHRGRGAAAARPHAYEGDGRRRRYGRERRTLHVLRRRCEQRAEHRRDRRPRCADEVTCARSDAGASSDRCRSRRSGVRPTRATRPPRSLRSRAPCTAQSRRRSARFPASPRSKPPPAVRPRSATPPTRSSRPRRARCATASSATGTPSPT